MLIRLFALVFLGAIKRFWIPAVLVIAAVAAIAFISGGSALWAAGITTTIALVVAVVASIGALNRPW